MKHLLFILALLWNIPFASAQFQFQSKDTEQAERVKDVSGPQLGASKSQTLVTGVRIDAGSQAESLYIRLPIPIDWPEQKVVAVRAIKLDATLSREPIYNQVDAGAKELILQADKLRPGRPFEVIVEIDLLNHELLPPDNPDNYVIPKQVPHELKRYVEKSPLIESGDKRILALFNDITKDKHTDWEKVEAIYSYVQRNVNYDETTKAKLAKGALAVIAGPPGQWKGDCKDMSCLFVAICRAGKIPARLVRVPEHCYAEFYLEPKDAKKGTKGPTGFWFPCQVAGSYSFGGIPERQPILQKGDSYPDYDSDNKKARYIFLKECCEANVPKDSAPPKVRFVRELR